MEKIYWIYKDQIEFDKILTIQFKSSNSYSLFPYHQPVVLWG